jgi:glycosyltransferase involved in cell wall biosynthesis
MNKRIHFTGALYDDQKTNSLRAYSHLYFHGHSSGGTNPSLLEAMASRCLIVAHDNMFNKTVLQEDAFYFSTADDIKCMIEQMTPECTREQMVARYLEKIKTRYNWEEIIGQYERFMLQCLYIHSNERNILSKEYSCE